MAPKTINNLPLLLNLLIFMLITSKLPTETHAFSTSLIQIDSIESPLFPKSLTKEERHKKLSRLTITRAHHLRTMGTAALDPNSLIRPPVFRVLSNLYVI
ncbi:hypothetical protein PanWU01x14_054840 [Parasponia andersonii]|uniref:Transmembrane protein n=1 Tax=Parasponia andersonii TaxID=3476 RepID=A0A2P5DKW3_PARAD|nr:hypothetical protein PanWU01x14_054840 [Parasponia andersonii]